MLNLEELDVMNLELNKKRIETKERKQNIKVVVCFARKKDGTAPVIIFPLSGINSNIRSFQNNLGGSDQYHM